MTTLQHFHTAQDAAYEGYATALFEIRAGRKRSHWIWYIFPQLAGLGKSSMAHDYALRDLAEACAYLKDPILRQRYEEIASAVYEQLEKGVPIETLMGGSVDALKLVSSLTLFHAAASHLDLQEDKRSLVRLCDSILQVTSLQNYPVCETSLEKLAADT